jgi:hypothetical protein
MFRDESSVCCEIMLLLLQKRVKREEMARETSITTCTMYAEELSNVLLAESYSSEPDIAYVYSAVGMQISRTSFWVRRVDWDSGVPC